MWHRDDHGNILPVIRYADDGREMLVLVDKTGAGHFIRSQDSTGTETFSVTVAGVIDNGTIGAGQLTGTVSVAHGGTGSTTAAGALTNLGAMKTWSVAIPPNSTAPGSPGDMAYDPATGKLYVCYATNQWARFDPASTTF